MGYRQQPVVYERTGRVACITLNRPDNGNAINRAMYDQLTRAMDEADRDDAAWVVLLSGEGDDFCRGLDWAASEADSMRPPRRAERPFMGDYYAYTEQLRNWWMRLWDFTKPIVTRVQGEALGWGADLVLLSHTVIAGRSARIGDPSIRMGLVTQNPLWSWRVGPRRARQHLMLGETLDASSAQKWGLVTVVVPDDQLVEEAMLAAETVAYQGGIVGWDGRRLQRRGFGQVTHAVKGISASWASSGAYSALSAIQRRGVQPGEFDFEGRREEAGIATAMREMEQYYRRP